MQTVFLAWVDYFSGSDSKMPEEPKRLVRIPLPISLIRRIDGLVNSGVGGFRDRSELIKEALEEYVLELSMEKAPELIEPITRYERTQWAQDVQHMGDPPIRTGPPQQERKDLTRFAPFSDVSDASGVRDQKNLTAQLRFAEIRYEKRGQVVAKSLGKVREEPMFGLHNRDYPSLWAAVKMVGLTLEDLVEPEVQRSYLVGHAWSMGEQLTLLDQGGQLKLPALFPTNKEKRPSAEDGFMNFAVGTVTTGKDGEIVLSGPLFLWQAAGVEAREISSRQKLVVGLTEKGYALLDSVAGLTPEIPHPQDLARRFFEYLQANAQSDWWGFATLVKAVGKGIGRGELIKEFHEALLKDFPREPPLEPWTEVQAATNAAGYVARAREWGLLELKQHRGRYLLTDFGKDMLRGSL